MAGLWTEPSLEFGVKVVRVAGLDLERGGAVFVRYYVPAGDGARRLRVDTREVPCGGGGGGEAFWGELARFERWGPSAAAGSTTPTTVAPGGGIVFELRWRPPPSSSSGLAALLGMNSKGRRPPSRVVARAELAWHDVAASKPAAERWLTLSLAGRELSGRKAPKLLVEVDVIRAAVAGGELKATGRKASGVDTCCSAGEDCGQCGWVGNEEDMFLAATFSQ